MVSIKLIVVLALCLITLAMPVMIINVVLYGCITGVNFIMGVVFEFFDLILNGGAIFIEVIFNAIFDVGALVNVPIISDWARQMIEEGGGSVLYLGRVNFSEAIQIPLVTVFSEAYSYSPLDVFFLSHLSNPMVTNAIGWIFTILLVALIIYIVYVLWKMRKR